MRSTRSWRSDRSDGSTRLAPCRKTNQQPEQGTKMAALTRILQVVSAATLWAVAVSFGPEARAQASVPEAGGGSVTLAGQDVAVHHHTDYLGRKAAIGSTDT